MVVVRGKRGKTMQSVIQVTGNVSKLTSHPALTECSDMELLTMTTPKLALFHVPYGLPLSTSPHPAAILHQLGLYVIYVNQEYVSVSGTQIYAPGLHRVGFHICGASDTTKVPRASNK